MNPCILSYTCLSLEWKASSFLLLSLKGGLVFWLTFFFTQMFNVQAWSLLCEGCMATHHHHSKWVGNLEAEGDRGEKERGQHSWPPWAVLLSPVHRVHHELLICSVSQWSHVTHFPCLVLRHPRLCFHLGVTMHLLSQTFVCCEIKTKGLCPREVPLSKVYLEVPPPYEAAVRLVPESAF